MALEGTLKDFSLADIFQLIGLQRKTGILTLQSDDDTVTVSFQDGMVVAAESVDKRLEDRLGMVLLKRGSITEAQLEKALETQRETLQRLGYVLIKSGFITQDDLRRALQEQVQQMVYRLFRWKEGYYHFRPEQTVSYDRDTITPIGAENLLLEGARLMDEWPRIQQRINAEMVVEHMPVDGLRIIDSRGRAIATPGQPDDDGFPQEMGGAAGEDPYSRTTVQVPLSPEEELVYPLVNGERPVQELAEMARQPEFDTFKAIVSLMDKGLVQERTAAPVVEETPARAVATRGEDSLGAKIAAYVGALAALIALGIFLAGRPLRLPDPGAALRPDDARAALARIDFDRVQNALRLFELTSGSLPAELTALEQAGLLSQSALSDRWGKPYHYVPGTGGYELVSAGPDRMFGGGDDFRAVFSRNTDERFMLYFPPFTGSSTSPPNQATTGQRQ